MKTAAVILTLAPLLLSHTALATDSASSYPLPEEEAGVEAYQFSELRADAGLFAGYRFTDADGSREAAEYEYLEDSIPFGGDLRVVWHPHRLHLDFDFRNTKDYFGDAWYTYKDIVFARDVHSTFFHNLTNIDLDPLRTGTGVDIRDHGETYGLKTGIDRLSFRGTAPEFPLHLYVDGLIVRKSGDRQQRSLLGGAWFNDLVKSTQRRKIDFRTTNVEVGINSHLGPLELDYAHRETRFDVDGHDVLYDEYGQSGTGAPPGIRPAGVYPHNLIPEVKSSVDTVKIHTSYTGKIVAAGTFQRTASKNRHSGAESEYLIGTGEITVMPMSKLAFFFKYRHKATDLDNPGTVGIADLTNPANTFTYSVRPSISSTSNEVSSMAKYRPLSRLTLKAGYHYRNTARRHAEDWGLPDDSQEHIADLSARARIASSIQANAEYIYRNINDPARNTDPDSSHEGRLSLSWIPTPRVSMLVSYDMTKESRDDLHFVDTEEPDARDVREDSVITSISYQVLEGLSLTASYAYMNYRIQQDIEYHDEVGTPHVDEDVRYRNRAHSYSLDVDYAPHDRIALSAGFHYTIGNSSFRPTVAALSAPEPISSFSRMKTEETGYRASCHLKLGRGYSSRFRYQYANLDDESKNPYDDAEDGDAHILVLTLSKRW